MTRKLFPVQFSLVLILPPMFDQTRFDFHYHNAMIVPVHFKTVFSKPILFFFSECQMMPGHFHRNVCALISTEKVIEFIAPAIELFTWRLDVDCVLAETIRGFTRVPF